MPRHEEDSFYDRAHHSDDDDPRPVPIDLKEHFNNLRRNGARQTTLDHTAPKNPAALLPSPISVRCCTNTITCQLARAGHTDTPTHFICRCYDGGHSVARSIDQVIYRPQSGHSAQQVDILRGQTSTIKRVTQSKTRVERFRQKLCWRGLFLLLLLFVVVAIAIVGHCGFVFKVPVI